MKNIFHREELDNVRVIMEKNNFDARTNTIDILNKNGPKLPQDWVQRIVRLENKVKYLERSTDEVEKNVEETALDVHKISINNDEIPTK